MLREPNDNPKSTDLKNSLYRGRFCPVKKELAWVQPTAIQILGAFADQRVRFCIHKFTQTNKLRLLFNKSELIPSFQTLCRIVPLNKSVVHPDRPSRQGYKDSVTGGLGAANRPLRRPKPGCWLG